MTDRLPASTPRGDAQRPADVAGPDRAGQAVLGVVGQRDRVGLVVERHHRRRPGRRSPRARPRSVGADGQHDRRREPEARARRARCRGTRRRRVVGTYDATRVPLPRARSAAPSRRCPATGPRPRTPCTAGSSSSRNRSYAERSTRIRDRAQQSWPALSKTPYGAVAAAFSRSASAKTMLALLPPSSRVTRFTWSAQPAMICLPTSVEPVKHDLAHERVGDEPLADDRALAGDHREHALGQPGLERQLAEPDRGQRGELGRLEHDRVAGGERRREAPAGDRHREVPRHDDADDAERLVEGDVDAAGDRDLPAEQPLGRRRVVVRARRGRCRPPSARCRSCGRRCATSSWASSSMCASTTVGEAAQQPAAVGRARRRATSRTPRAARSIAASVSSQRRRARRSVTTSLGRRVDDVVHGRAVASHAHSRSKPRKRSQSVTARRRRRARRRPCWRSGRRPRRRRPRARSPSVANRSRASRSVSGTCRRVGRRRRCRRSAGSSSSSCSMPCRPPATMPASAR